MDEIHNTFFQDSFPYVISALTGISWKMYDDLVDRFHFSETSFPVEFSKTAVILFTTFLFLLLPIESNIFFGILILGSILAGEVDTSFWKSACILPIATTIFLYFQKVETKSTFTFTFDIGIFGFFIAALFFILLEEYFFPEETSTSKTVFRSIFFCIGIALSFFLHKHKTLHSISFLVILPTMYLLTSVILQFFIKEKNSAIVSDV